MKQDFYYTSKNGTTKIHAIEWSPEKEAVAVLQICHGMVEYIDRYDAFAKYLADLGYYVVGNDHLGHGLSIQSEDDYGFFHETKGNEYVIGDIHELRRITGEKYPGLPYYMLGHSMGSFLLRQYLTMYSKGLAGAIIMGTGHQSKAMLIAGQTMCRVIAAFKGWRYRSVLVYHMADGSYNKKFEPGDTKKDWISSDKEQCRAYVSDPLCGKIFTVNGYYQMFAGMKVLTKRGSAGNINKNLPILFVSGEEDPVGAFGKSVHKIYEKYKREGLRCVECKLYPGDRHEILHETDYEQVFCDLAQWMKRHRSET